MTRRALTPAEKRAYRAGGFRLEGSPRSAAEAARDDLVFAQGQLKRWGADAAGVRATLAAPSASTLTRWQNGARPIPWQTLERVAIVLALYRRCYEVNNGAGARPLPPLRRPGRAALAPHDLLKGGCLSDLLALWRQFARAEEAAEAAAKQGRRS